MWTGTAQKLEDLKIEFPKTGNSDYFHLGKGFNGIINSFEFYPLEEGVSIVEVNEENPPNDNIIDLMIRMN